MARSRARVGRVRPSTGRHRSRVGHGIAQTSIDSVSSFDPCANFVFPGPASTLDPPRTCVSTPSRGATVRIRPCGKPHNRFPRQIWTVSRQTPRLVKVGAHLGSSIIGAQQVLEHERCLSRCSTTLCEHRANIVGSNFQGVRASWGVAFGVACRLWASSMHVRHEVRSAGVWSKMGARGSNPDDVPFFQLRLRPRRDPPDCAGSAAKAGARNS